MPGIVVGVDGSAHSRKALAWALTEAALRGTPLTVMAVRPDSGSLRCAWSRMRCITRLAASGSSSDRPEAIVRTAPTRSVPRICLST